MRRRISDNLRAISEIKKYLKNFETLLIRRLREEVRLRLVRNQSAT